MINRARITISREMMEQTLNLPPTTTVAAIHYSGLGDFWWFDIVGDFDDIKEEVQITDFSDVGRIFQKTVHEVQKDVQTEV